tara:strand:- start:2 stop:1027 length:1026 start_codon:yes stop_codon:yes gene_type:complete
MSIDINNDDAHIIAEIGHNHQGSLEKALQLVKMAKDAGADSVKFQKRNNKKLYTKEFFNSKYDNRNSYGETYGQHRDALEFDKQEFLEIKDYSKMLGINFFATPFDFDSIDFLDDLDVPAFKIASADLLNTPLQIEIAKRKKKIFLSTGHGTLDDVKRARDAITKYNSDLVIMHCCASYPANISDLNLSVIESYKKTFPDNIIGLSDHENGIDAGPIAYLLGARVFEKHVTLDRGLKGTDHAFSLEPLGFSKFIRNIRRIPQMLGNNEKKILDSEKKPVFKMAKSIVAKKNITKGEKINLESVTFKSPGGGLPPYKFYELENKTFKVSLKEDEIIKLEHIE